jgi:hypothetical protein
VRRSFERISEGRPAWELYAEDFQLVNLPDAPWRALPLHAEVVADRAVPGLLLIVQSGRPVRACDTLACASKGDRSRLETPTRRARLIRLHETRTRFHAATTRNFLREGVSPPAPAP